MQAKNNLKHHNFHIKGKIFSKLALGETRSAALYIGILERTIW